MGSTKLIPARPPIRWLTDYLGGSYRTKPEVIQAGPYPPQKGSVIVVLMKIFI